jgi:ectoine hydroxylase-related dioxygenase (phytanoyl-CoA dioxygenase family)
MNSSADISQQGRTFKEDGLLLIDDFLGPDELAEVDSQLNRFVERIVPTAKKEHVVFEDDGRSIRHISGLQLYDEFWFNLRVRPEIIALLKACLGGEVEATNAEVFYKPARVGGSAPAHQDNAYLHLAEPANACAIWVALDDTTAENGAVVYARGSHRLGVLPHIRGTEPPFSKAIEEWPDEESHPSVAAVLPPGGAAVHHVLTVHQSGPNHTSENRRGLVMNYVRTDARIDEEAHARHMAFVQGLHDTIPRESS